MLDFFEERCLLSTKPAFTFLQTNLTSDIAGLALNTDPNLINPWGLTASPTGPFWVSDNNAGVSTLYNGQGQPQPAANPLVVNIPQPDGTPGGAPTGVVFNSSPGFKVAEDGVSAASVFLFATEDGTIAGWSPKVDPTNAVLAVDNSAQGAVYKGLAIGKDPDDRTLLYAANFRNGTIDVFDKNFSLTTVGGDFTDPNLPDGYAPFNVQNLGGKLYVTYALQDDAKHDDVPGEGNGFVDVFDTNGNMLQRLISNGLLNSPWGLALAPADFGPFGNDLLVGNFGDGHINAFDPTTGDFVGQLTDSVGNHPITIGGLWALSFGNGGAAGDPNTLFFTAGIDHEQHGLFGEIQAVQAVTFDPDAGSAVLQTNLVSDLAGVADHQDPNLINPWGLAASPKGPFWVSDNNSGVSTLYDGQGQPQPAANPLVVNIPLPDGTPGGSPTGVVFNGGTGFQISADGNTAPGLFLFATEEGTISGWNPQVDPTNAVIAVDNSAQGADYTGLTLATASDGRTLLYAANHATGTIDVFDENFNPVTDLPGTFQDDQIPAGFTPYNVQNIGGRVFVTYSLQDGTASQAGDGFVDVFTSDGVLDQRLIANGPLDAPWGIVVAPEGFGQFSHDLLVGNVADGHINAFDEQTGAFLGELKDGLGNPIAISGLWALRFGNGGQAGDSKTLFFTAGIGDYQHGLFGSLQVIDPITVGGGGKV
jgi:uncharacterized protein (TIGR03118 family)